MPPKSGAFDRTAPYRSARTSAFLWAFATAAVAAALVAFGFLLGYGTSSLHAPQPFQSLAQIVTKAAVAAVLALVIVIALAWCCRLALLAWLTWKPGQIVVPDFTKASDLDGATEAQLSSDFRNRIALLRLQSAAPTPGAAPAGPFADVLDTSGISSSDVLKTLVTLLRAAIPSHAIEIHGTVRQRPDKAPNRYGVAVQAVLQLRGETSPLFEVWETSWDRALKAAADGITAAILPHTRACRGPWAAWRGYAMPAELLRAYEAAAENEQKGLYDAALKGYVAALKHDPTNVQIRLHLGQLEEKLGLFLQALTTYQSIHALSHPGGKDLPRGLYRRGARREWDRAEEIAKYRELVMLGEGSIIAQWCRTERGEHLPYDVRESLRKEFTPRLRALVSPRGDPVADGISRAISALLDARFELNPVRERELAQKLRRWAYCGAEGLRRSLPISLLRPNRRPLTRTTVGLSLACIRQRYELAAVDDRRRSVQPPENLPRVLHCAIAWAPWRPGPWTEEGWIPPTLRRRQWHERYNAACLYAIPLTPGYRERLTSATRDELAKRAVDQLERATATADSSFVATRRDWVLEQDRDLIGLRTLEQFESFASVYFPEEAWAMRAVEPQQRLAESRYIRKFLAALADSWHDVWHARATRPWDVHTLHEWYSEELELWKLVGEVAHDGFDWRKRDRLQQHAAKLLSQHRREPVEVSFEGSRNGAAGTASDSNWSPRAEVSHVRRRLGLLAATMDRQCVLSDEAHLKAWLELLRRHDAESLHPLSRTQLRDLCECQAATWRALSHWMDADGPAHDPYLEFKNELQRSADIRRRTEQRVRAR